MQVTDEIKRYLQGKELFTLPQLQKELRINYFKARTVIDKLLQDKSITECGGGSYCWAWSGREKRTNRLFGEVRENPLNRHIIRRSNESGENDWKKKRMLVLKYCVEQGYAYASMISVKFNISYSDSFKLINWMYEMGFTDGPASAGISGRRMRLTKSGLEKFLNENNLEDEDDLPSDQLFENSLDLSDDDEETEEKLNLYDDDEEDVEENGDDNDLAKYGSFERERIEERRRALSMSDIDENRKRVVEHLAECIKRYRLNTESSSEMQQTENIADRRSATERLIAVLKAVKERKSAPVSPNVFPQHPSWTDDNAFDNAVMERINALVASDRKMGHVGAIKKAETFLEAVRDTHDRAMVQVYERIVYELKNISPYLYNCLRKKITEN